MSEHEWVDPEARRARELAPLADALAIHVRGIGAVTVVNTGGNVYCAEATLGAWTLHASEDGWSLTDADGHTVALGGWYAPEDDHSLTLDPDTGTLDPDECEAAARTFADAFTRALARDSLMEWASRQR